MSYYGSTIGVALKQDSHGGYDQTRVAILKSMVYQRYNALIEGRCIADNLQIFIKPEPHKVSKIRQGRFRLISAVSLVDQMVDRVLFGPLTNASSASLGKTPCLVGWTPVLGGFHYLNEIFRKKRVLAVDKTAWDWTVKPWLVKAWAQFIAKLAIHPPAFWLRAVETRLAMLFRHAVFQFPDGTMTLQPIWGVMKTGCYLTLLLNSVGQSMVHYLTMRRLGKNPLHAQPLCFGDDTVQFELDDVEAYLTAMATTGCLPKIETRGTDYSFVGWDFKEGVPTPSYAVKHVFNMIYAERATKVDLLVALQYMYVFHPLLIPIQQALATLDPSRVKQVSDLVAFMRGLPRGESL